MPEVDQLIAGRYRLGPAIGSGGMGTVRRARDLRFDRDVAVKLLRTSADPRHQERMRREVRLLGALQHPAVVAAYDTGIERTPDGAVLWLAMELVRGPDLGVLLEQRGRLDSEDVRRIVHDVASALTAMHQAEVVHRDLKPANVLLTREPGPRPWQAKVADLGIASTTDATTITTTGQVMGTAAYLSPEQVSGAEVGPAADVYALGLLALVALTGTHPFPGGPVESATARLVRPPSLPDWITGGWRMLLTAMTAVDPVDRPRAEQVLVATAQPMPALVPTDPAPAPAAFDDGEPTVAAELLAPTALLPARGDATAARRRPVLPLAVAAAVLLGLAGGGVGLLATVGSAPSSAATPRPTSTAVRTPPAAPAVHRTPLPTATPTVQTSTARPVPVRPAPAAPVKRWNPGHGHGGSHPHPGKGGGHGKG